MTTLSVDEGVGHKHRTALCKVCAVGNTRRHAPGLLKVRNNLRLRRFDGTEVPVSHTSHLEDPGETASSRAAVAAPHVCSNRWWERQRGGERTPATCCVFAVWLYQPRRAPPPPWRPHLAAIEGTEAHVSAEDLEAGSRVRDHLTAPQREHQRDAAGSWPDLRGELVGKCIFVTWSPDPLSRAAFVRVA